MSKTLFVSYRNQGFWAFDLVSAVFLKHLIDVAAPIAADPDKFWLVQAIDRWRVNAIVSDIGLFLDEEWSEFQRKVVIGLIDGACRLLANRDSISADEITGWEMLGGERIFMRGLTSVSTKSIIRLGQGISAILDGSLPTAPAGTWWFFGPNEDTLTMLKRSDNQS